MGMTEALMAAVGGLATVVGVMWVALQAEIKSAKTDCAEDRKRLWELVRKVSQLDRRRDWNDSIMGGTEGPGDGN